ncbi:MAG: helix-turn-helix domain-containing protein [Nocardioidaceae bacterium]
MRTRLRSLRQALGWSLDLLGERSNLSPSTISRIETGKRTVSLDVLRPMARAIRAIHRSCSSQAVEARICALVLLRPRDLAD